MCQCNHAIYVVIQRNGEVIQNPFKWELSFRSVWGDELLNDSNDAVLGIDPGDQGTDEDKILVRFIIRPRLLLLLTAYLTAK
jgi:hypothetical protein